MGEEHLTVTVSGGCALGPGASPAGLVETADVGAIVLTGTGALTAREWYHKALAVFGAIGFAAYIALLFTQLR